MLGTLLIPLFNKKNAHPSLKLRKGLCTQGVEHGRDVSDPSHISPFIPPVLLMQLLQVSLRNRPHASALYA